MVPRKPRKCKKKNRHPLWQGCIVHTRQNVSTFHDHRHLLCTWKCIWWCKWIVRKKNFSYWNNHMKMRFKITSNVFWWREKGLELLINQTKINIWYASLYKLHCMVSSAESWNSQFMKHFFTYPNSCSPLAYILSLGLSTTYLVSWTYNFSCFTHIHSFCNFPISVLIDSICKW